MHTFRTMVARTLIILCLTAMVGYNDANPHVENRKDDKSSKATKKKEQVSSSFFGRRLEKRSGSFERQYPFQIGGLDHYFNRGLDKRCGGGGGIETRETVNSCCFGQGYDDLDKRGNFKKGSGRGEKALVSRGTREFQYDQQRWGLDKGDGIEKDRGLVTRGRGGGLDKWRMISPPRAPGRVVKRGYPRPGRVEEKGSPHPGKAMYLTS